MPKELTDKEAHGAIGVVACILAATTGFALADTVQLVLGDWLGFPQAETASRVVLAIAVISAVCSLILWMLRGEWMAKRFSGAWLPGALLGIPVTAVVSIALGVVSRINESQAWLDAALMLRISRMIGAAAMPLTVLGCCLYVGIRRRCIKK